MTDDPAVAVRQNTGSQLLHYRVELIQSTPSIDDWRWSAGQIARSQHFSSALLRVNLLQIAFLVASVKKVDLTAICDLNCENWLRV